MPALEMSEDFAKVCDKMAAALQAEAIIDLEHGRIELGNNSSITADREGGNRWVIKTLLARSTVFGPPEEIPGRMRTIGAEELDEHIRKAPHGLHSGHHTI